MSLLYIHEYIYIYTDTITTLNMYVVIYCTSIIWKWRFVFYPSLHVWDLMEWWNPSNLPSTRCASLRFWRALGRSHALASPPMTIEVLVNTLPCRKKTWTLWFCSEVFVSNLPFPGAPQLYPENPWKQNSIIYIQWRLGVSSTFQNDRLA